MSNVTRIPIAESSHRPSPTTATLTEDAAAVMEQVMLRGDLAKLTEEERVRYYMTVCQSLGLNPLTRPFEYIVLDGKLTLYATRSAADQMRALHKVSVKIEARETFETIHTVHVRAWTADGREDEEIGSVSLLYPERTRTATGWQKSSHPLAGKPMADLDLANVLMKAVTKAKRRATLSICGLGFVLDETEVEDLLAAGRGEIKPQAAPRPALSLVDSVPAIFADADLPSADGEAPAPVAESVPVGDVPATTHELPGGPVVASSIPVYAPEVVDAAVAAIVPDAYTPETIDQAPLHGALRKLGDSVKKARAAQADAATDTAQRAADPMAGLPADVMAAITIVDQLREVAHHPGRLTARHSELAGRIAALSESGRALVEQNYAAFLAAARAAYMSGKRR